MDLGSPSPAPTPAATTPKTVAEVERDHIQAVLEQAGGRIRGGGATAEILGLKLTALESRMKKLGIRRS